MFHLPPRSVGQCQSYERLVLSRTTSQTGAGFHGPSISECPPVKLVRIVRSINKAVLDFFFIGCQIKPCQKLQSEECSAESPSCVSSHFDHPVVSV